MKDVASRFATPVRLAADGLKYYLDAVDHAFGIDVDYAQIIKHYGQADASAATRYSPAKFVSATKEVLIGDPAPKHISTRFVERANLSAMRMLPLRNFTRLTNGFSKKAENHAHMVALYTVWLQLDSHPQDVARYSGNGCRSHGSRFRDA